MSADSMEDITPQFPIISAKEKIIPESLEFPIGTTLGGLNVIVGNLTVKEGYIQSGNYSAGVSGWQLTPTAAQLPGLTLVGGIFNYGKTSFSDSVNAGYYLSSEGWYIGAAADATKLKYTLADGTFDFVGTHSSGSVGGVSVTQIGYVATATADAVPTGLTCSSTAISTGSDGSQSAYVILTWTAISTNTFDHYLIRYKKAALTYYTYIPSTTNTITIEGLTPNISYNFGISSVNKYGSQSAFSADIAQTTASDTVAPATVTASSATAGIQYVILEWTHNTESDLASYNIYRSETNDSATSTLIGNCRTNYFIDGGRTGGTTYYYWVKAVDTSGNISASFSIVKSAAPTNVESDDIVTLAGSKVLIDGTVYLSNWRHASDLTKIDGGDIYANSVTTTQLNFTPVQSTDVIAKINASVEGITIDADNIAISGSTTFSSGYDPTSKVDELAGTYASAASGARVLIFPAAIAGTQKGLQITDDVGNDVFSAYILGSGDPGIGDVIIGNYSGGQGIKYDKSVGVAGSTTFQGLINTSAIQLKTYTIATLPVSGTSDTGLTSPTATGGKFNQWTNPTNAYSSNDSYASATNTQLKQSYETFGFSIPTNSTILGIEVVCEGKEVVSSASRQYVNIYNNSSSSWATESGDLFWGAGDTTITKGSSSSLWGKTWVPSDFNNGNFSVYILHYPDGAGDESYLDHIQVKVYYLDNDNPVNVGSMAYTSDGNGALSLFADTNWYQCIHTGTTDWVDLTDAGDSTLHYHSTDRDSANFTGTDWTDLTDAGDTTLHKHDTMYYTEDEVDDLIDAIPIPGMAYSDTLRASADTTRGTSSTTPVKVKQITYYGPAGYMRIKFDLVETLGTGGTTYGRVYRNGVAVGTEQTTQSLSWVTKTQDIEGWSAGDQVQLYIWHTEATGNAGSCRYFRIYGDFYEVDTD